MSTTYRTFDSFGRRGSFPSRRLLLPALLLALAGGCDTSVEATSGLPGDGNGGPGAGSGGRGSDGGVAGGDLPCDVAMLLGNRCVSCHGNPPSGGAPMSLLSRADLLKASYVDPARTFADRALARMQDPMRPMPPAPSPAATPAEIMALSSWIAAGMPAGNCQQAMDPFSVSPTCTSMQTWFGGNDGSGDMRPGAACISCHRSSGGEAPSFLIAGTVYPTAHEPDDCLGGTGMLGVGGVTVVITDANKQVVSIPVRTGSANRPGSGNFYLSTRVGTLTPPFSAKVTFMGRERAMNTAQDSGDCNSCHTQTGANGAPGRILLP